jgi:hypothetical protein
MKSKDKVKTPPEEQIKRRGVRLNRPQDVRRLLSRCINQTLNDDMSTDKLRAISYSCQTILKVFEISEVERRLIDLEARINAK